MSHASIAVPPYSSGQVTAPYDCRTIVKWLPTPPENTTLHQTTLYAHIDYCNTNGNGIISRTITVSHRNNIDGHRGLSELLWLTFEVYNALEDMCVPLQVHQTIVEELDRLLGTGSNMKWTTENGYILVKIIHGGAQEDHLDHHNLLDLDLNVATDMVVDLDQGVFQGLVDENLDDIFDDYDLHDAIIAMVLERAMSESLETSSRPETIPASKSAIENLEKLRIDSVEEAARYAGSCTICMDNFESGVEVNFLPCLHFYHGDCIVSWLKINYQCPLCRYPMPHDEP